MRRTLQKLSVHTPQIVLKKISSLLLTSMIMLLSLISWGQTGMPQNQIVRWVNGTSYFGTVSTSSSVSNTSISNHTTGGVTNPSNVTDSDTTNFAILNVTAYTPNNSATRYASIDVYDNNTTSYSNTNKIVGFELGSLPIGLSVNPNSLTNGISFQISYNGTSFEDLDVFQDKKSTNRNLFYGKPTAPFKKLRLRLQSSGAVYSINFYGVFMVEYNNTVIQNTICNQTNNFTFPNYNLTVTNETSTLSTASVTNVNNILTSDTTYATMTAVLGANARLRVNSLNDTFSKNAYVGFKVSNTALGGLLSLDILSGFTIIAYRNNTAVQTISSSNLLVNLGLLSGITAFEVGGILSQGADALELRYSSTLNSMRVYNAVYRCAQSGPALACNTTTYLTVPNYPVSVNMQESGLLGINLFGQGVENLDRILDSDTNNYASINSSITNIGNGFTLSVKKSLDTFSRGTYVGFEIGNSGLLDISLPSSFYVATYLNGVQQETSITNNAAISVGTSLLNGSGRTTVGFETQLPYNEIRLLSQSSINISLFQQLRIYGVKITKFCPTTVAATCNTPITLTKATHPIYVDGKNTGVFGLASVSASLNNTDAAIDNIPNNYTSIDATLLAGGVFKYAVRSALDTFNQGTNAKSYVSFDIGVTGPITLDALSSMRIALIKPDGTLTSEYNPKLLAGVGLLTSGENKSKLGIIANEPFVGAVLVKSAVAAANVLGELRIYGINVEPLCEVPITCKSYLMSNSTQPVIINNDRTGTNGLVHVSLLNSTIENLNNVIDADSNNYATIKSSVGVIGGNAISIENPLYNYPVGSLAGFRIRRPAGLLTVDLLNTITIQTYKDGFLQESKTGVDLMSLELLGISIIGTDYSTVGFITNNEFDEIRLVVGDLLGVTLAYSELYIYGAFVDTRTVAAGNIICFNPIPDISATYKNIAVSGSIKTNDLIPPSTGYGLVSGAPTYSNATFNLSQNGQFTFNTNTKGKFDYQINACLLKPDGTLSTVCKQQILSIIVIDTTATDNYPIINHDAAIAVGGPQPTTLDINVLANDGIGNRSAMLNPSSLTIVTHPTHGIASVAQSSPRPGGNGVRTMATGSTVIQYTSNPNYVGLDEIWYSVMEVPSNITSTAKVQLIIQETLVNPLVCIDDYNQVPMNATVNVDSINGLMVNDNNLSSLPAYIVPVDTNIANVGHLTIQNTGAYTFSAAANFMGPVQFPYTYTNGEDTVGGTLHLLVSPFSTALNINLIEFNARELSCNTAGIQWKVADEAQVTFYEIQFSVDGKHFTTLKKVKSLQQEEETTYTEQLHQQVKAGYYRLKIVEEDGTISFSNIERLALNCFTALVNVSPNPTSGKVKVTGLPAEGVTIQVSNIQGRIIQTLLNNSYETTIDLNSYASGMYIIQVNYPSGSSDIFKVTKQ